MQPMGRYQQRRSPRRNSRRRKLATTLLNPPQQALTSQWSRSTCPKTGAWTGRLLDTEVCVAHAIYTMQSATVPPPLN
jgi:hypothetical protein